MRPDHKTTVKRNFKKICFLCPLLHWCCCNERTYGTKKSLKSDTSQILGPEGLFVPLRFLRISETFCLDCVDLNSRKYKKFPNGHYEH